MQKHLQFHGSDLEKIEKIYNIPKEEIVCFASNVNPLGLSEQVKNQLVRHLDIITTYPDRNYIVQTCQKLDIFVMIDETYIEFVSLIPAFSAVCLVPDYDNLMVLRGVSKFFAAPGLRLGYGMTSNVHFRNILKEYQNPWSLNSVGAFAGELFLQDTDYIQKTRQLIETERTRIYETLQTIPELKAFKPSANFVLVQILKEGVTSVKN